jgi:uncharacterized protein YxjI
MTRLLDQTDLLVNRRPKVFETRRGYDIYDRSSQHVGSVEQVGRDNAQKLLRPQRLDHARTSLEMTDPSGVIARMTHVQALKSSLEVELGAGGVGRIILQNLFGRSRFALEVAGDQVGAITAATWRKRNFVAVDDRGTEIADVDMTHGSSADRSNDNRYAVRVAADLNDPFRIFAFVAVIAIDTILWNRS